MDSVTGLLSIIIPVYNVKPFLHRCVDSVLAQTYSNIEIILVNDGSTDGSEEVCRNYSKQKNVVLVEQKNSGQSAARNAGLDIAKGEYIAFLDSDDYIEKDMYSKLIFILEKYKTDISACASQNEDINGRVLKPKSYTNEVRIIYRETLLGDLYCNQNARSEVWNKVFRRNLIKNIRFKENQIFEEIYFDRRVFMAANGCAFLDYPYHHYLYKRPGNTNSSFDERKMAVFKELDDVISDLASIGATDAVKKIKAMKLLFAIILGDQARRHRANAKLIQTLDDYFCIEKELPV